MSSLIRVAVARPIAVSIIVLMLLIFGVVSWQSLELNLLPKIHHPVVSVNIEADNRSAADMESAYSEKVERLLFTVSGLTSVEQTASKGLLNTRITFDHQTDVDIALFDVNRALSSLRNDRELKSLNVTSFDPRQSPILVYGLVANDKKMNLFELKQFALKQISPLLEKQVGIAEVEVKGGRKRTIDIKVDPTQLNHYQLSISQVIQRLKQSNINLNYGSVEEQDKLLLVQGDTRFYSPDEIENVVISHRAAENQAISAIKVSDIAQVDWSEEKVTGLVKVNNQEGLSLAIYKESQANTVKVAKQVEQIVNQIQSKFQDIKLVKVTDQAGLINQAISEVNYAGLLGILLAAAILSFFLRDTGPTFIVAISIPVSLISTVMAMKFFGLSLNLLTLGGLALGAGMLVDNAIVVVESIYRKKQQGQGPIQASVSGAQLVAAAIITSTLTSCIVFLPILFIDGMIAELAKSMAFSVIVSLLISLLVALLLIPTISRLMLFNSKKQPPNIGADWVENYVYRLLEKPSKIVVLTATGVGIAVLMLWQLGSQLFPASRSSQLNLSVVLPSDRNVDSTARVVDLIESMIQTASKQQVKTIISEVGKLQSSERTSRIRIESENIAMIRADLDDKLSTENLIQILKPEIEKMNGVQIDWTVGGNELDGLIGENSHALTLEVSSRYQAQLEQATHQLTQRLSSRPEFWSVTSSAQQSTPEFHLKLDSELAAGYGITLANIQDFMQASLSGVVVNQVNTNAEQIGVLIKLPQVHLNDWYLVKYRTESGATIALSEILSFERKPGAQTIYRKDQKRIAKILVVPSKELALPEARKILTEALNGYERPFGVEVSLAGNEQERVHNSQQITMAAVLALLLVFMLLAASFESFLAPIAILSSIPIAAIGVALVLVPFAQPIGVMAGLGIMVLIGVAVNDAILILQQARLLIAEGMAERAALAKAAGLRLRPILMTSLTTILALVPLTIGTDAQVQLRGPLALTIIGGMLTSTIGSLTVVPCLYYWLSKSRRGTTQSEAIDSTSLNSLDSEAVS